MESGSCFLGCGAGLCGFGGRGVSADAGLDRQFLCTVAHAALLFA
jgi:hypothetical protein